MRAVQQHAIDLFEARGFAEVSIEEIAGAADVSPASVYRYFTTKEGIVFWDEYDPLLAAELARAPVRSTDDVRHALIRGLATISEGQARDVLRRTELIFREPALRATLPHRMDDLAMWIATLISGSDTPSIGDEVSARASVGALLVAIDWWQRSGGDAPLAAYVEDAFDAMDGFLGRGPTTPSGDS